MPRGIPLIPIKALISDRALAYSIGQKAGGASQETGMEFFTSLRLSKSCRQAAVHNHRQIGVRCP
jgi:hypothetical protein